MRATCTLVPLSCALARSHIHHSPRVSIETERSAEELQCWSSRSSADIVRLQRYGATKRRCTCIIIFTSTWKSRLKAELFIRCLPGNGSHSQDEGSIPSCWSAPGTYLSAIWRHFARQKSLFASMSTKAASNLALRLSRSSA